MAVLEEKTQLIGQFWVRSDDVTSGEHVTGILNPSTQELQILGEITPSIIWTKNPDGTGNVGIPNTDSGELVVLGNLSGAGRPVTLVNARTYGRTMSFPEVVDAANTQHFRLEYAVEGAHLAGPGQLYSASTFSIGGLDEWAQFQAVKLQFTEDRSGISLDYQSPDSEVIELGGDLGVLSLEAGWTLKPPSNHRNVLETPAQYRWTSSDGFPKTLQQIRAEIITPLQTLLGILFTHQRSVTHIRVLPEGSKKWCEIRAAFVGHESSTVETKSSRPLLTRESIGRTALKSWICGFETMSPFPSMLVSSFESSSALETQTLEMALAAEGLHRRLYRDARNLTEEEVTDALAALEEAASNHTGVKVARDALSKYLFEASFPQRIQRLAEDIAGVAPATTGRTNRWKHAVTDVRNAFAHASLSTIHPEDRYAGYVALLRSLQWLIWIRVLLHVGVDPATLRESLAANEPYKNFLWAAKQSLPAIFGDDAA